MDILLAFALLELLGSCIMTASLFGILWYSGIDSGVMFVPDALLEVARYALSFNPVLHAVEWMCSAYYQGYRSLVLDKIYLLAWVCSISGGFALERFICDQLLRG